MKHADTRIYTESIELVRQVQAATAVFPRGYAFLTDQLRRAVSSVPLNFAEGMAKEHRRDRRRFFVQARGSANEVIAAVDVGHALGIIPQHVQEEIRDRADHIAAMLSNFR